MRRRLKHALDWRLQAVVSRLDALAVQLSAGDGPPAAARLDELAAGVQALQRTLDEEVRPVLRALAADESANRRRLHELRAAPGYEQAWTDPNPLVSVTLPTRDRAVTLANRALPSVLAQTHEHLEVLVVGDAAESDVAEAAQATGDPRVRWTNLSHRVEYHPDAHRHWLVGSALPRNEARRLARGVWLLHFDDDDALRPDAIESLLARARETRAEVVYGGWTRHDPDGTSQAFGELFPPLTGEVAWQGALHHAGLPFDRELVAAALGLPGDAWLLERMLRAGVRFAMVDRPVWDYFPSGLWEAAP